MHDNALRVQANRKLGLARAYFSLIRNLTPARVRDYRFTTFLTSTTFPSAKALTK